MVFNSRNKKNKPSDADIAKQEQLKDDFDSKWSEMIGSNLVEELQFGMVQTHKGDPGTPAYQRSTVSKSQLERLADKINDMSDEAIYINAAEAAQNLHKALDDAKKKFDTSFDNWKKGNGDNPEMLFKTLQIECNQAFEKHMGAIEQVHSVWEDLYALWTWVVTQVWDSNAEVYESTRQATEQFKQTYQKTIPAEDKKGSVDEQTPLKPKDPSNPFQT